MILRKHYLAQVKKALARSPIVALIGPRQCGKTTLARQVIPARHPHYFDLEDPVVARLMENPMTALQGLRGLVWWTKRSASPDCSPSCACWPTARNSQPRF